MAVVMVVEGDQSTLERLKAALGDGDYQVVVARLCDERALRGCVERLVADRQGEVIAEDLPPLVEVERRHVLRTLELLDNNKSRTAKVLGIGKKTLYRRLHEYGVPLRVKE